METQPALSKKIFLQNDKLLVFSLLFIYGLCMAGIVGAGFLGFRWGERVDSIKQAQATATAHAYFEEQDTFEYIERFDKISGDWFVGEDKGSYGDVVASIDDGVYVWKVNDPMGYIQGEDFYRKTTALKDYDVYVDIRFAETPRTENTCSGLAFRKSIAGWDGGAYVFSICDDGYYQIEYIEHDTWETIQSPNYSEAIHVDDWNRVEVSAVGNQLKFTINAICVLEIIDDHRDRGGVSLYISAPDGIPTVIWFDNFGFQTR